MLREGGNYKTLGRSGTGPKSEKYNNIFKQLFSLIYDVLVLFFKYISLRAKAPNPRHVVRNLFSSW